ncbi:protein PAT1 homolog 2 isoform X2 [Microcaecilia unicolor]|uniref:Protein PAT1 homolog 2 isoform X2 n=1 Tax=Microcaecilia unicolor TaxID=1415580 RepID=A0A6P7YD46_9AMPH|nr:protein PAT1 homolog 2 isoform X2 [Microcaecilia unicolor]
MDTDLQHLPEDYYLADEGAILEEMAEEDEEIDLYNEETFGLDQDSADEDSRPLTLPEISETTVGLEKTGLEVTRISETMEEEGSSIEEEDPSPEEEETGVSAASSQPDDSQDLDDPAVMRAVHGKPTLESLDSAVVDSGICSTWGEFEAEQDLDKEIIRMMESVPQIPAVNLDFPYSFLQQQDYMESLLLKQPGLGISPKAYTHRFPWQSPGFMPRTPFRSLSPNISTPTRTMAPKMAHMQFGTLSPNPSLSPLYSPFARTLQRFRVPDHVTQLHPQHRRILSQRRQRTSRHSSWKHWEARTDPYNCLMSPSEKEWVIKVQMIQLQSENPHLDDYYYQAYYEKLERKLSEEELLGERIKREPTKLVTPYIQKVETYESVVHIEGSLGQVAVSTCYSPRRAIDAICHTVADEDMKALGYQRLRILNRIEKLFLMLLDVEEIQQEISLVPEEQRTHFHEKQDQKVEYIFACLRPLAGAHDADEVENEFLQSLSVRKGKKLLARLIPYLCGEHAYEMLLAVVQHLPRLMRMDVSEEALPVLYQPLNTVICQLTFTKLIGVLQELVKPVPDSEDLPLAQAFQNQFGVSLLYSLLSQGERLLSSDTPMEPSIGDYEKWTDLVFLVAKELSRLSKTCVVEPLFLPSNLLSLFCRYLDKQTIHGLENKMECQTSSSYPAVPS